MSEKSGRDGVTKLPKLTGAKEFENWRQHVKDYFQQPDVHILGLNDRPDPESTTKQRRWIESNVKAKSAIKISLADGPLAQMSTIVDGDSIAAKELWTELVNIYRMSNTKRVINIGRDIETMHLDKDEELEKKIEIFHQLTKKLASYEKTVSAENKV